MKFALVMPPGGYYARRWTQGIVMPPLGLASLATVLREAGFAVEVIDAHIEELSWRGLRGRLRECKADVVGVTFTTETRFHGFRAIREARRALPHASIVAGGPHATLACEDTLLGVPALDMIVRGEGERTIVELAEALQAGADLGTVKGISFRKDDTLIHNPPQPPIEDLDSLPIADRKLLCWDRYNFQLHVPGEGLVPAANMFTSRGCPYGCHFCSSSAFWGRRVRTHSAVRVLDEIAYLANEFRVQAIWFCDDTFTLNREWVKEICAGLLQRRLHVSWFCEVRADTVDRELLERMRRAGCRRIGVGVESGSQRVRDQVLNKSISEEKVRRLLTWCEELGIAVHPFFILSHPTETVEEARKTVRLLKEFRRTHEVALSLLHIYPGTRLEQIARRKGILPHSFRWSQRREPGVHLLAAAQGEVPLFLDKLSLNELADLSLQCVHDDGRFPGKRAVGSLVKIRTWEELRNHLIFAKRALAAKAFTSHSLNLARGACAYWRKELHLSHKPMRLWVEPTNHCNLKCSMCPQSSSRQMTKGFMNFALFQTIIEEVRGFSPEIVLHHRGESLLHPQFFKMARFAQEAGLRTRLHTNATLLDEERSRALLDSGIDVVSFSFDGYSKTFYERIRQGARFDRTLENITRFLEMRRRCNRRTPRVTLEFLGFPQLDVSRKRAAVRSLRARLNPPPDAIVLRRLHNWADSVDVCNAAADHRRFSPCPFPWFTLVILWNGDVLACPQDFFADQVLGNVGQTSLEGIWNGKRMLELRQKLSTGQNGLAAPCAHCDRATLPTLFGLPIESASRVLRQTLRRI